MSLNGSPIVNSAPAPNTPQLSISLGNGRVRVLQQCHFGYYMYPGQLSETILDKNSIQRECMNSLVSSLLILLITTIFISQMLWDCAEVISYLFRSINVHVWSSRESIVSKGFEGYAFISWSFNIFLGNDPLPLSPGPKYCSNAPPKRCIDNQYFVKGKIRFSCWPFLLL